ncbi:hypothetical protein B0H67DRAFT_4661 [Lasiosphaeris hirsuta]|uniref:Uncharacterized protein n=1 Tax=Lasiosphaeris hirsuta TaxID=260670 RepID=A0AA40B8S1_9PEZI|nr:hypothetical protein B0H67DRAFT_4661 [Lasiosphaeris hirsuta]
MWLSAERGLFISVAWPAFDWPAASTDCLRRVLAELTLRHENQCIYEHLAKSESRHACLNSLSPARGTRPNIARVALNHTSLAAMGPPIVSGGTSDGRAQRGVVVRWSSIKHLASPRVCIFYCGVFLFATS